MRYESAACVPPSGRQLYVTGVGQNMKETWKLDPESGWTRCADMNQDRRRHCATFVNDASMYVLGGMSTITGSRVILDSIEKYDVETNAWKMVGRLKYPTCLAACAVFNESIYVFGGRRTLQKASLGCVQVFDTVSGVCEELPQRLPRSMQMLRAVTWNGLVIITGKTECVIFDLQKKAFQTRNRFKSGMNQFGLVLENDRIYLIGGHTKETQADGRVIRPASDEVKSVAVRDVIDDVNPANWIQHARLLHPAFTHAFAVMSLPRAVAE